MPANSQRLAGKLAIITGGGSGIGRKAALLFGAEGASVVIIDRDAGQLAETAALLTLHDVPVLTRCSDVADENRVAEDMAAILTRFGRADVLLAAAGFSGGTAVPDTTLDAWNTVIRTNLTGSFLWSRAVLQPMRAARSGSIILVGSQLAFAGGRSNAAYLAAKGGIVSLMQSMAVDHAGEGVRVNAVIPGAIDTPMLRRSFGRSADPASAEARSVARHPMGRLGLPEEVARAALYLASDDASFTTGACLRVDGGWLAG
ncbi:MAG: SDR family oxidoreductase [Bosea sp. (in: a-proteobacteria)]